MTTVETRREPVHVVALSECKTLADKVRYACEHAPSSTTQEVREWLLGYGIETKRPYVSTIVNQWRRERNLSTTGDLPKLTPGMLAELDRMTNGAVEGDPALQEPERDKVPAESANVEPAGPAPAPASTTVPMPAEQGAEPTVSAEDADVRAVNASSEPVTTSTPSTPARAAASGLITAALGKATRRISEGPARNETRASEDQQTENAGVLRGWHIAMALVIAVPAFLAVWSGWIGLGQMTGWKEMDMLPGFNHGGWAEIDTSVTLPIGIEAFGALSLAVWLASRKVQGILRTYSAICAFGSLTLGALGQVAYHVLKVNGTTPENVPDLLVGFVAVLPVIVFGACAGLIHLAATHLPKKKTTADAS